ncbi:MAG: hypothetical protein COB67_03550 [SAR324 cluster bacterium]|uniref:Tetratricopeptide repeat protein n=1 Tax=SAR324 cluster bacterium TaxID=2024889 RepID=A0A2A4T845_9DELT|nr:MAG: hypothetical protein COB67_03550 [SAR324 cluster bacterium]
MLQRFFQRNIGKYLHWFSLATIVFLSGCNYNYYQGQQLEQKGRFEEANIEYHRAYSQSPDDLEFRDAYNRTARQTSDDLMKRYQRFLKEKKYPLAFRKLEQAHTLTPNSSEIQEEKKKWFRILLAGKVSFNFQSLRNQIPLTDEMELQIHFNTADPARRLVAAINNQDYTFSIEDILYQPPQSLLMYYTVNSIGVKLVNNFSGGATSPGGRGQQGGLSRFGGSSFHKFIDFKTPILTEVKGSLEFEEQALSPVRQRYPLELLTQANPGDYWVPSRGKRFSVNFDQSQIKVKSSTKSIDFLPQMLYINKENQRIFLDFGNLEAYQRRLGGAWAFRRHITEERKYLRSLEQNILLTPYFYFREGGFPFVKE